MTALVSNSTDTSPATEELPPADASLAAFTGRELELDGSITQFRQQGADVNFRLMASDEGQSVWVQNAAGDLFDIPVSPGQTHVTAQLPADFVASESLTFRVD